VFKCLSGIGSIAADIRCLDRFSISSCILFDWLSIKSLLIFFGVSNLANIRLVYGYSMWSVFSTVFVPGLCNTQYCLWRGMLVGLHCRSLCGVEHVGAQRRREYGDVTIELSDESDRHCFAVGLRITWCAGVTWHDIVMWPRRKARLNRRTR